MTTISELPVPQPHTLLADAASTQLIYDALIELAAQIGPEEDAPIITDPDGIVGPGHFDEAEDPYISPEDGDPEIPTPEEDDPRD